jgi:hypothetical protein
VDALHGRPEAFQLVEEREGHEVSRVEDEVGATQLLDTLLGQLTPAAWKVRVGDDGDAAQEEAATRPGSCTKRPAFQTSSPSA